MYMSALAVCSGLLTTLWCIPVFFFQEKWGKHHLLKVKFKTPPTWLHRVRFLFLFCRYKGFWSSLAYQWCLSLCECVYVSVWHMCACLWVCVHVQLYVFEREGVNIGPVFSCCVM